MKNAVRWIRLPAAADWREVVWPKEHGSWSLAFEPLAFGLLAAPSPGGAWLGAAVALAFFARRPLRIAWRDASPEQRVTAWGALAVCGVGAAAALFGAIAVGGVGWLVWLGPAAIGGAIFLWFDLQNAGREAVAEVAGAAAFATLPAALATLAGWPPATALALAVVMIGRSVPAVLTVRAALRHAKTGEFHRAPALIAAGAFLAAGIWLADAWIAPRLAVLALAVLTLRTIFLLVYPRPQLRARTIGMIETVLGLAFVVAVALANWPVLG